MRIALLPLALCMLVVASLSAKAEVVVWVSPAGSDTNQGTKDRPFATPAAAVRHARELRRLGNEEVASGVRIILRGGVYRLTAPLSIRPEDSGAAGAELTLEPAPGEFPVLSGGVPVAGWRRATDATPGLSVAARGKVWVAEVPEFQGRPLEFRQLWVAGQKATRAREPDEPEMARLTEWRRDAHLAGIPSSLAGPYHHATGLEMTLLQMWEIAKLRVKKLTPDGDQALVEFQEPESRLEFEHPWPQPVMEPSGAAFYLSGALELLDQPGEWHLDRQAGKVYYWPRTGEDLARIEVIAPALETLVKVSGSLDRPVGHVVLHGIGFQHTTWLRPSQQGHVPLQSGMYLTEAYKLRPKGTPEWRSLDNQAWIGRPPAAVLVQGAHDIELSRCRFEHLASAGLDFRWGTRHDLIHGCVFRDIGGNGLQLGSFQEAPIETHLAYHPEDQRAICVSETIRNNLVTHCGTEDWGCVGICVGYGREVAIEHNEVAYQPYTGISLGWGWTRDANAMRDNRVVANRIHHVASRMSDSAGVYTLSAQPGTVIQRNYIHSITMSPYVHDPEHWFYLYLDEGSSHITVRDNWCPAERFLSNAVGPGNVWENNGPSVSETVQLEAGLQSDYRDLSPDEGRP
ncbi:right-handed parallel beta-helix repeat-containing protein [Aeoliella sp. ICT_H6.2]|uniref:Right-handed parallel beta-helix repeat-containing protein n=1 Tax=Aeoliella straminimaris TaxID=2954799 RepID=A0A9X2JIY8_9BACT|nr:right-handed parallel beta-helix repeat-containing protein [Aeoliella straminimaris]MCO6046213.1 right-handed parallel beta-helix repeat-containing protein [Aeoliella straminimaris]